MTGSTRRPQNADIGLPPPLPNNPPSGRTPRATSTLEATTGGRGLRRRLARRRLWLRPEHQLAPRHLVARPPTQIGRAGRRVEHHHVDRALAHVDLVLGVGKII